MTDKALEAYAILLEALAKGQAANDWLKVKITPVQWDIEIRSMCER